MIARLWLALAVLLLAGATEAPPEPSGYRMDEYRAPVPATLQGATVLSTAQVQALWEKRAAAFVDVLPQAPRPAGLPVGTIWHPKVRKDLPGSIWLPDTGYGALAPVMADYLARNLWQVTKGDHDYPLVFYCLAECWMSWNAAKRALALGYTQVNWYPEGTDGWAQAGLPLESREPMPRPEE